MSVLIKGGTVVNAELTLRADVICDGGLITAVGADLGFFVRPFATCHRFLQGDGLGIPGPLRTASGVHSHLTQGRMQG